jgi:hypothetical protein
MVFGKRADDASRNAIEPTPPIRPSVIRKHELLGLLDSSADVISEKAAVWSDSRVRRNMTRALQKGVQPLD